MFSNYQYYPNRKGNVVFYILLWYQIILFFFNYQSNWYLTGVNLSDVSITMFIFMSCLFLWMIRPASKNFCIESCKIIQRHELNLSDGFFCSKRERSGKGITFSGALILTFSGRKKSSPQKTLFCTPHHYKVQRAKNLQ